MSQEEFNELARRLPVLVNMRPFGDYSMVDVDAKGGLQVIVKELLDAGFLDGRHLTCTGETLAEQVARLAPPAPDQDVIYASTSRSRTPAGCACCGATSRPTAAPSSRWPASRAACGTACSPAGPASSTASAPLIDALDAHPDSFEDNDMVVIRYDGPRGAPGMPELLDPTSRITALCRHRHITIALMTDARFSGGSVGLVIGHVAPEALLGGPIALVEDGDTIVVDVNTDRIDCPQLAEPAEFERRAAAWQKEAEANGGLHPDVPPVKDRVLARMRATALPALLGGGMATP